MFKVYKGKSHTDVIIQVWGAMLNSSVSLCRDLEP